MEYDKGIVLAVLAVVILATPVSAQTAVDGDTIKLDGTTWRLFGIDASEKQMCSGQALGIVAAGTLDSLMKGKTGTWEDRGRDRSGRSIGLRRADGRLLSAAMVALGMAWAFPRYSWDYVGHEERARRENLSVHAFRCQPAWEWRKEQHY